MKIIQQTFGHLQQTQSQVKLLNNQTISKVNSCEHVLSYLLGTDRQKSAKINMLDKKYLLAIEIGYFH